MVVEGEVVLVMDLVVAEVDSRGGGGGGSGG